MNHLGRIHPFWKVIGLLLIICLGITAFHFLDFVGDELACKRELLVCEEYNIDGLNCVKDYQTQGLFGSSTDHVCEGYGPIQKNCIKVKRLTRAESNVSVCH